MKDPVQTRYVTIDDLNIAPIVLEPAEMVEAAFLILRTVAMTDEGRQVRMVTATSQGMDFMIKRAMIELAHDDVLDGEVEEL